MRTVFSREITPPNLELQRHIYRKLAELRNVPRDKKKSMQKVIQNLRRALPGTFGHTHYYMLLGEKKTYMGDADTSKKHFLLYKDDRYLAPMIREHRKAFRNEPRKEKIKRYLDELRVVHNYEKTGGVMSESGQFLAAVPKVKRAKAVKAKVPTTKDSYIGIELEYASRLTIDDIIELLIQHNLVDQVRVVHDGSIRVNEIYKHKVEFCILTKWSELHETLEKLRPILFDKPQNFSPNTSCGFHVHLDMRNDDPNDAYRNLANMQTVLFGLAADYRRENTYCVPAPTEFEDADPEDHYAAISRSSYEKHGTIEVRIHQSTLDLNKVEKWIRLLKRIASYQGKDLKLGTFESEFGQLREKLGLEQDFIQYIQERQAL